MSKLVDFADLIETKFRSGRAADVTPEILNELLQALIQSRDGLNDARSSAILRELESSCYAALAYARESAGRVYYFSELQRIAGLLRGLEGGEA